MHCIWMLIKGKGFSLWSFPQTNVPNHYPQFFDEPTKVNNFLRFMSVSCHFGKFNFLYFGHLLFVHFFLKCTNVRQDGQNKKVT